LLGLAVALGVAPCAASAEADFPVAGVTPDIAVPAATALKVAHLEALRSLERGIFVR